jgi:predicted unusual protein kinase regulating ubiquinone biosynthesis (AarF/ABC1/UbiB family)
MILAPKYLGRVAATAGLFTRYGLSEFARDQGLDVLPKENDGDGASSTANAETAKAFRERLVELGPAYIKLGQMLSSRRDLLPEVYITELEKLQDDVEPTPFGELAPIIEEELGGRISKLFESFDEDPLGSASLGQAHAATLRGGREVVVKVQRPNIREKLAADIEFFREFASFMTDHTSAGRRVDFVGIIRQLERALADELDYRVEARNAAHFRRSLAQFPRLLVPRVIDGYSTERVLTTERVRGVKIDAVSPVTRTELDLHPIADELMRAYLKQITIEGHFHADPHPGNVFILLPDSVNPPTPSEIATYGDPEATGDPRLPQPESPITRAEKNAVIEAPVETEEISVRLSLIDFGMTARLTPTLREACVRVLLGLSDDRGEEVAETLIQIGEVLPEFDRVQFVSEISEVVSRSYRLDAGDLDAGRVLFDAINASYRRGLRLPAELTLLAKALANLGDVSRTLDPTFRPLDTVRDYLTEIATMRARHHLNPRQLYKIINQSVEFASALPHRLDVITKRLADNDLEARVDLPQVGVLLEGLQKVANRVFTGLVLASIIVASAMLLPERRMLGSWGFVIAAGLALYMVISILWSDRHPARRA